MALQSRLTGLTKVSMVLILLILLLHLVSLPPLGVAFPIASVLAMQGGVSRKSDMNGAEHAT